MKIERACGEAMGFAPIMRSAGTVQKTKMPAGWNWFPRPMLAS
jgi:hypothetical protein